MSLFLRLLDLFHIVCISRSFVSQKLRQCGTKEYSTEMEIDWQTSEALIFSRLLTAGAGSFKVRLINATERRIKSQKDLEKRQTENEV